MKQRLKQMQRVTEMRALRERICEAASVRAAAQLRVVERSLCEAEAARAAAIDEGRNAILQGDRASWVLADAMREVAGWNRAQLQTMCVLHQQEADAKLRIFRHSRMQREQSERLVRSLCETLLIEDARQEQAQSDDRFAGRLHWSAAQGSMKPR